MDLTDIYRTFTPKEVAYTFFSNTYGLFSKIDHMVGHKTSLYKLRNIEFISIIFSDHTGYKVEINLQKKNKQTNSKTLKYMETERDVIK